MNGSPHLDQEECEEEEEEGEKIPIEWVNQAYKFCPHQEPLHSREKGICETQCNKGYYIK